MDDMHPAMRDLALGGEDEEWQDFIPPSARRGGHGGWGVAYLEIRIKDNRDGSATVTYFTNDTDGDGVPDRGGATWEERVASWDERWPSADEALSQLGPSGIGPNGRIVTVFHNGAPIR